MCNTVYSGITNKNQPPKDTTNPCVTLFINNECGITNKNQPPKDTTNPNLSQN